MPELTKAAKNVIEEFSLWQKSLKPKQDVETIHVDEVASKVAVFYENIRTIIDWKEEHLMRRAAIIRKLKRRFVNLELNNFSIGNVAEPLVLELIRGGYFPNDKIPVGKVADVQKILEKYVFILQHNPENQKSKVGIRFYTMLIEIAACEVEECLVPSRKEMALIDFMFAHMKERIKVHEVIYKRGLLREEDKDLQIYIAVQQALFKLDAPIISYNLIKYKYPQWMNATEEELFKISQNIHKMLRSIEKDLSHTLAKKFYNICERYDTPYLLFGDVLSINDVEKTVKEISNPASLEELIRTAYIQRLKDLKERIRRAAIYSTTSIFVTKILSLVVLEWIVSKLLVGHFNLLALVADILIPTTLMALMIAVIRPPSAKNMNLAVMETIKIVYQRDNIDFYEIKPARKKSVATRFFLSLIYLLGAVVSLGALISVFIYFDFPVTSIVIDLIFIALILFAGTAVQRRAKELTLEEESGGFVVFVSDVLLLPITSLGRWMSNTWKEYNAIAAFFNALIDMPFSVFVEFIEGWRYFMKEKKEDLR